MLKMNTPIRKGSVLYLTDFPVAIVFVNSVYFIFILLYLLLSELVFTPRKKKKKKLKKGKTCGQSIFFYLHFFIILFFTLFLFHLFLLSVGSTHKSHMGHESRYTISDSFI